MVWCKRGCFSFPGKRLFQAGCLFCSRLASQLGILSTIMNFDKWWPTKYWCSQRWEWFVITRKTINNHKECNLRNNIYIYSITMYYDIVFTRASDNKIQIVFILGWAFVTFHQKDTQSIVIFHTFWGSMAGVSFGVSLIFSGCDNPWVDVTFQVCWSFDHDLLENHDTNIRICIQ